MRTVSIIVLLLICATIGVMLWIPADFTDQTVATVDASDAVVQTTGLDTGADDTADTAAVVDAGAQVLWTTAESLNMRSAPSTTASLVGGFPQGTRIEVEEISGNWARGVAPDGRAGWLSLKYLSDVAPS
ncbi:MAG: Bacterial domain [Devosia sp.]|nr:Bacterial domain [Devosia sp.]